MANSKQSSVDVSVLVLGYNNLVYLDDCFSSILAQEGPSFEVLYIDNASADVPRGASWNPTPRYSPLGISV